jgi:hypothetical protein
VRSEPRSRWIRFSRSCRPLTRYSIFGVLLLLAAAPARPSPAGQTRLKLTVQVSELSNLIYQLDCLSGFANCSQSAYLHLWKTTLHWTAEDQSQLEQWKLLRRKYHGPVTLNEPEFQPATLPWNGPTGLELGDKFSIATFYATDEQSLRSHWEVIVAPADLPRLESMVGHFQPRFSRWWSEEGQEEAARFKRELQNSLQQQDMQVLLGSFATFYDADVPDGYPVYLNLFLRPRTEDTRSKATMLENHAAVEFIPGEDVNRRLTIVIHEICHFLYSSSPDSQKQRLINAFADSPDSTSLAAWGLLNEGLATALGNGIAGEHLLTPATYKKQLQSPLSLYNDASIDASAKALIPFLKTQLSNGKTVYDADFVDGYLGCLKNGMSALLMMPARLLTELTIIYASDFADVFQHEISPQLRGGIYPFEGVENGNSWAMHRKYPKLNAVVLLSAKTLPLLRRSDSSIPEADFRSMQRASYNKDRRWVYSVQRFPSTYVFVIYGQSGQDISAEFSELMKATHRFTGFMPEAAK